MELGYCLIFLSLIFLFLGFLFYRYRKRNCQYIKSIGLLGPEPHWLFGNIKDIANSKLLPCDLLIKWNNIYGKTYGYYLGPTPFIVSSDLEFIRQVFIKKFANFTSRKGFSIDARPDDEEKVNIFNSRGDRWRRFRTILSSIFSTAKLRTMIPSFNEHADILTANLLSCVESNPVVDIYPILQRFALDVMCDVGFGVDTKHTDEHSNLILQYSKKLAQSIKDATPAFLWAETLPEISRVSFHTFNFINQLRGQDVFANYTKLIEGIISKRINGKVKRNDFLQLMIDARYEDGIEEINSKPESNEKELYDAKVVSSEEKLNSKRGANYLTHKEITMQSIGFFFAGFETTSMTILATIYQLAKHQEIQNKVRELINNVTLKNKGILTYDDVRDLKYLDLVIEEAFRFAPFPIEVLTRKCDTPCEINGIPISKGTVVQINAKTIHGDATLWGSVPLSEFYPERFGNVENSNRDPLTSISFGLGPRACIAKRFALIKAKIALCKLIQNFSFHFCEQTEDPINYTNSVSVVYPTNGIKLRVKSL